MLKNKRSQSNSLFDLSQGTVSRIFINCYMKESVPYFLCLAGVLLMLTPAFACNECHSKNPKMVKMHQELGYKDCFVCHSVGGKKSPEEQRIRMASDQICVRCHKK
jgi:predicted CXXCH cytochrome family protein